jgi:putative transposase
MMFVRVLTAWFYLVDVLDGYSRLLGALAARATMRDWEVTQTLQEALEKQAITGEGLSVVHDRGSQFVSHEWRSYTDAVGLRRVPTRLRHPESNGVLERLHRTHRAEGPFAEAVAS